jgi:aerobic carbon-monoxide dehydrogenase medium subunit
MTPFAYHRPASIASAVQLRSAQPDATYLAGGQSLLPAMKLGLAGPSELIDLSLLPGTQGITLDGSSLRIGAMTPHAAVAASSEVLKHIPSLACLASGIGDPAVRSRGTVGGSLAQNDPAACWPAAALGLGATVHTDRRQIAADDFFKGLYETALEAGELITAVSLPVPKRAAYVKFKQPASRFALVGVFVSEGPQGVRVAVTGAGPCVFRADTLEAALAKGFGAQALDGLSVSAEGLNNDLHGSAAYRAHLVGVLARRAVAQAV